MSNKDKQRIEFFKKQCNAKRTKITLKLVKQVLKDNGKDYQGNLSEVCERAIKQKLFTKIMIEAGLLDDSGHKKGKGLSKTKCKKLLDDYNKIKKRFDLKGYKKASDIPKKDLPKYKIVNPLSTSARPVIFTNVGLRKVLDKYCRKEKERTPRRKSAPGRKSLKKAKRNEACKKDEDCNTKNCFEKKCGPKDKSKNKKSARKAKSAPKQKRSKRASKPKSPVVQTPDISPISVTPSPVASPDYDKVLKDLINDGFTLTDLSDETLKSKFNLDDEQYKKKKKTIKRKIKELVDKKAKEPKPENKFEKMETAEDGACLFNAVEGFLYFEKRGKILRNKPKKEREKADRLRRNIVKRMRKNKRQSLRNGLTYPQLADFEGLDEEVTNFNEYLEEMSKRTTWGSQAEIAAISEHKKRSIEVYTCENGVYEFFEEFSYKIPGTNPIYIYYNASRQEVEGGSHFEYLVKGTPNATKECEDEGESDIESSVDISDVSDDESEMISDVSESPKTPSESPKTPSESPKTPTPSPPKKKTPTPKASPVKSPEIQIQYTDKQQKQLYDLRNKLLNIKENDIQQLNQIVKELSKLNKEKVKKYHLDNRKEYIIHNLKKIYKKDLKC